MKRWLQPVERPAVPGSVDFDRPDSVAGLAAALVVAPAAAVAGYKRGARLAECCSQGIRRRDSCNHDLDKRGVERTAVAADRQSADRTRWPNRFGKSAAAGSNHTVVEEHRRPESADAFAGKRRAVEGREYRRIDWRPPRSLRLDIQPQYEFRGGKPGCLRDAERSLEQNYTL